MEVLNRRKILRRTHKDFLFLRAPLPLDCVDSKTKYRPINLHLLDTYRKYFDTLFYLSYFITSIICGS